MTRGVRQTRLSENPVLDKVPTAVEILVDQVGMTKEEARAVLGAVVRGGYVIAPREPTNVMFLAYMDSYGQRARTPQTVITNMGKARCRWKAMGEAGTKTALSYHSPSVKPGTTFAKALGKAGGAARALKLSPERRSEIARQAALARWAKTPSPTKGD